MTTTESTMIAVGSIPLNPGMLDLADAEGKIVLWVKDEDEGRSVYLAVEMYGVVDRAYPVAYADFEKVITNVMGKVIMADHEDPFAALLTGESVD